MKKIKWPKIKGIDWLNHLLGFLSVVLGVLLAFWLNDWNEQSKQQQKINQALLNLKTEFEINLKDGEKCLTANLNQFKFMSELNPYIKDNSFQIDDSTLTSTALKYNKSKSDLVHFDLYGLSSVAYTTFRETNIITAIDFALALKIQEAYILQEKIEKLDDDVIDEIKDISSSNMKLDRLLTTVRISNDLANVLIKDNYPESLKAIEDYLREHNFDSN